MPKAGAYFHVGGAQAAPLLSLFVRPERKRNRKDFFAGAVPAHGADGFPDPQDLNCFGGFGQQGYGYMVEQLYMEIGRILGMDRLADTILLGAGNLGRAIVNHMDFENRGIRLTGIFDDAPEMEGTFVRGLAVQPTASWRNSVPNTIPLWRSSVSPRKRPPRLWQRPHRHGDQGLLEFQSLRHRHEMEGCGGGKRSSGPTADDPFPTS